VAAQKDLVFHQADIVDKRVIAALAAMQSGIAPNGLIAAETLC
jgi:hypothetical protein